MAAVFAPRGSRYYAEGHTFAVGADRLIRDLTPDEAAALARQGCRHVDDPPPEDRCSESGSPL